jgi:secondary thiamine-phosphate synthase enzyme
VDRYVPLHLGFRVELNARVRPYVSRKEGPMMKVYTAELDLESPGEGDITDITPLVDREVAASGIDHGMVTVFVPGATAGITTIEFEGGLVKDFKALWERLAPRRAAYEHDNRWGDGNGHSHVRASLLGPSLTIPLHSGKLIMGTWQQIVLVDFDNRPRTRRFVCQVMGLERGDPRSDNNASH